MGENSGKAKNFLQKMYHFRVKVDRRGEPIVNVSSIFGLACLLFAPHMTVIGAIAALALGYQFRFESEEDDGQLEERIRRAAENVKAGVAGAAKSIQNEINKASSARQTAPREETGHARAETGVPSSEELLKDLKEKAAEPAESNPAATTFHSAYAASAGSVPVLRVSEEPETPDEPSAPAARGSAE